MKKILTCMFMLTTCFLLVKNLHSPADKKVSPNATKLRQEKSNEHEKKHDAYLAVEERNELSSRLGDTSANIYYAKQQIDRKAIIKKLNSPFTDELQREYYGAQIDALNDMRIKDLENELVDINGKVTELELAHSEKVEKLKDGQR